MKKDNNKILSVILALIVTFSLVACGEKKESQSSENTAANTSNELSTLRVQADKRFKSLLGYVPADTAYLFTNKKAIPEDLLEPHLNRFRQMMDLWLELLEDRPADIDGNTSESSKDAKSQESTKDTDFLIALLHEVKDNLSVDKMANVGIKIDGHSVFYQADLAPVFRTEISSKKALLDTIKKAEKQSGYRVQWKKCSEYDCIDLANEGDKEGDKESGLVLLLQDKQIAAGIYTDANKQKLMDHLTGKSKPASSYAAADWDQFLAANDYPGYGDGFLNLQKIYGNIEQQLLEQAKSAAENSAEPFDEKRFKACSALVARHLQNVPEAYFGMRELQAHMSNYEIVLKTSPTVTAAVSKIPNLMTNMQQSAAPIFDLGLNINIATLRDALMQYTNFLVKNAEELHCDAVNGADIRKAMGGFTMATMMGVNQFKTIYVSLNDFKMNADANGESAGKVEKLDLYASVTAENPAALLQMLGMVNPAFATIELPKDGTATRLPEGLIPPNPSGFTPEVYLSQKDQTLNILVGNMKPALKAFKSEHPVFYWNTVDSKRYNAIFTKLAAAGMTGKQSTDPAQQKEAEKAMQVLQRINELSGQVQTMIGTDERGVVIHYTVTQ